MGKGQIHDAAESEQMPDSFLCCVCLDLLCKPIVLSCGHICCFWCVHKSMKRISDSHCPICRNPYHHFPTICQMLHFILLKMYPIAYKRRQEQILEEEEKMGFFSPQFDDNECGSRADQEYNELKESTTLESNSHLVPCSIRKMEPCAIVEQTDPVPKVFSDENFEVLKTMSTEENKWHQNRSSRNSSCVLITDVQCVACRQMLFHPVVLNCGHVYCETCIINPKDKTLRCQICQSLHPRGLPKVCLELDHFLEEQFPKEYTSRRDAAQLRKVHVNNRTTCSTNASKEGSLWSSMPRGERIPWWADPGSKVHIHAGCDSCGVFPIVGDRYKCNDCVEKIGFDLCGDCYNTRSKQPGRFNQQHTPEHKFELVEPNTRNMMLRLVTGQLEAYVSTAFANYDDAAALEPSDNGFPAADLSSDSGESTGNGFAAAVTQPETEIAEDENETQSTS